MPNADVAYGTLDQAVARMSAGSWLFVLDLRFYSTGRRQFGKYNYLPFGLKLAPGINDTNVKESLRILRLRAEVDLLDFVDDLLGAVPDESTAWQNLCRAVRFLLRRGIPISASPLADPPATLSELSRAALAHICSALGTPPARSLHCGGGPLSAWGQKSPEFADWANLAREGAIRVVERDASKMHGWPYHLCWDSRVVVEARPENFAIGEAQPNSLEINYTELRVAVQRLLRESSSLKGWRVLFRLDNSAAVHCVNVRYGRMPSLESLAHRFESAEQAAQCWALALRIPGKSDVIADAGSRSLDFARSWREDLRRGAALRKALFQEVESRCGVQFAVDMFTDGLGRTAFAREWRFPELSVFQADLRGHVVWAHPPRALLKETFQCLTSAVAGDADLRVVALCP
ncbi:unnamed protein product, partial [Prorocentrum cordatum]